MQGTLDARSLHRDGADLHGAGLPVAGPPVRETADVPAVTRVAEGVAHNFNNVLLAVVTNLELLAHTSAGDAKAQDLIGEALDAALRGGALTRRLLACVGKQALRPGAVDLGRMLHDLDHQVRAMAGPSIAVSLLAGPGLWTVRADPERLVEAVLELVRNAVAAMPVGGLLEVWAHNLSVRTEQDGGRAALAPGRYGTLVVRDSGVGMVPGVLARATEPFFSTRPLGEAMGLGLSEAAGFARQSKGALNLDSRERGGTTAWLYLPAA